MRRGAGVPLLTRFIFIAAMCSGMAEVSASPHDAALRELRREFVRLRNIDPTTDDRAARPLWKKLSNEYMVAVGSIQGFAKSGTEVRALVDAAMVFFRLFGVERDDNQLEVAASLLAKLPSPENRGPGEDFASVLQELLLRGDIALARGDEEIAREWYSAANEMANTHAEGVGVARDRIGGRLVSLKNGTFSEFLPTSDIQMPRMLPSSRESKHKKRRDKPFVVVVDPGHGGDDSGAVGRAGLLEKEVTLEMAYLLREELARVDGVRVSLTRDSDEFVPLARRTQYANHQQADVFISLHNNASPSHALEGFETYYLDNTDDQAGKKLAERENSQRADGYLSDIDFMLSDLIQTAKLEDSMRFASVLDAEMGRAGARFGARSKGVKRAPFFVLVGAHMPCVLVELLFIDNINDAARLTNKRFKNSIASSIARGIGRFFRREG